MLEVQGKTDSKRIGFSPNPKQKGFDTVGPSQGAVTTEIQGPILRDVFDWRFGTLKKSPKCQWSCSTPETLGKKTHSSWKTRNPFNWYIKPYKVDNHPLLYGKQREFRPLHELGLLWLLIIVVSLTSRDFIHQQNLEQISRAVSKYRPKICLEILSPAFWFDSTASTKSQKKTCFHSPPKKSNQIPTKLPPNQLV